MVRLVVFDCDGTLVDSQHSVVEAMRQAFAGRGLPVPAAQTVRRTVGLSLTVAMGELYADGEPSDWAALARDYRAAALKIRVGRDHHDPLYPGAAEAIAALHTAGYLLGVATGKSRHGLNYTLDTFGLRDRFVTLQTADDAPSKPHPEMLRRAMAETGSSARETLLVGDTTFDVEMAISAGASPVGVSWGYHHADELRAAGAQRIVDSFAELTDAIAGMGQE